MNRKFESFCVYCGSSFGVKPEYLEAATEFGGLLAQHGIRLIYGGGRVGLMGAVADAALAAGGKVIGVIPQALMNREVGHGGITELRVVRDMHERKMMMADLSDAFVALPGGWGTLEEWTETLTWRQLKIHDKPIGLLNIAACYDPLLALADAMIAEGFVKPEHRRLFEVDDNPARLLEKLQSSVAVRKTRPSEVAGDSPPPAP